MLSKVKSAFGGKKIAVLVATAVATLVVSSFVVSPLVAGDPGSCGDGICNEWPSDCPQDCCVCGDGCNPLCAQADVVDPDCGCIDANDCCGYDEFGFCSPAEDNDCGPAGCPEDSDCDGVLDEVDNCPFEPGCPPGGCPEECPTPGYCGDGFCDLATEDSASCPEDCWCGDGWCDASEDPSSCPVDCMAPVCGDGFCDQAAGENSVNCSDDCYCGNGFVHAGEQCDDGNKINGDGCSADCVFEYEIDADRDEICSGDFDLDYPSCEPGFCKPQWNNMWRLTCDYYGELADQPGCEAIDFCYWADGTVYFNDFDDYDPNGFDFATPSAYIGDVDGQTAVILEGETEACLSDLDLGNYELNYDLYLSVVPPWVAANLLMPDDYLRYKFFFLDELNVQYWLDYVLYDQYQVVPHGLVSGWNNVRVVVDVDSQAISLYTNGDHRTTITELPVQNTAALCFETHTATLSAFDNVLITSVDEAWCELESSYVECWDYDYDEGVCSAQTYCYWDSDDVCKGDMNYGCGILPQTVCELGSDACDWDEVESQCMYVGDEELYGCLDRVDFDYCAEDNYCSWPAGCKVNREFIYFCNAQDEAGCMERSEYCRWGEEEQWCFVDEDAKASCHRRPKRDDIDLCLEEPYCEWYGFDCTFCVAGPDNCPSVYNPDQLDSDFQNGGDVCDACPSDSEDNCDTTDSAGTNIDESGGTLVTDSGNVEVDIPADALSEDTSISVTGGTETPDSDITAFQAQTGTEAASLIFTFGPEGTTFGEPVTITLRYDETGIDESTVDIYSFNTDTQEWEPQEATCDIDENVCTLTVMHFSDYIVGADVTAIEAKQRVIDDLSALLSTGDEKTAHRITKAIDHIEKSLAPDLWETDWTLSMKGKKVFDEEKKAVKELMKIDDPDVSDAINSLVGTDVALAQAAIDQAIAAAEAAGCEEGTTDPECGKTLREIAKAQEEIAKAQEKLDEGKYDKAIDHYKKAWDHSQKAMKKTPEPDGSGD